MHVTSDTYDRVPVVQRIDQLRFDQTVAGTATRRVSPSSFVFRASQRYFRFRRLFDVVAASLILIATAPLTVVACAAIAIEDGAPVLFCQQRVGRYGRLFTIYKLRTMRKELCGDAFSPTAGRDSRITRVGFWLRKLSIDELPQLFNIIRGDMTFVGPRPEMPFLVRNYQSWQHLRHLATPGVTGLWQITCRSTVPLHLPQATVLDLAYIRRASHITDLIVLLKTIRAVIGTGGAY